MRECQGNVRGIILHGIYKERGLKCVGSPEIVHNGMCSYDTPGEEPRGIEGRTMPEFLWIRTSWPAV